MRAIPVAVIAALSVGCSTHSTGTETSPPYFRAGEDWILRYRLDNGADCTLVLRVTHYADPVLFGIRQSESCRTEEAGSWVPAGSDERRIDITTLTGAESVAEARRREERERIARSGYRGSFHIGCLDGLCKGVF